jgi:hypothetical protein
MKATTTTNTHDYDGVLAVCQNFIHTIIAKVKDIDNITKLGVVQKFSVDILKVEIPEKTPMSITYFNVILNSWGTQSNYDSTNDLHADNLLYICALIWNKISVENCDILVDFAKVFFVQCEDIKTGPCPQGRVARLWQVVHAFLTDDYV